MSTMNELVVLLPKMVLLAAIMVLVIKGVIAMAKSDWLYDLSNTAENMVLFSFKAVAILMGLGLFLLMLITAPLFTVSLLFFSWLFFKHG
jgi:hypothetical protein